MGARLSPPSTARLTPPWPISSATFGPSPPFSSVARCAARSTGPPPSGFPTIVVTPCARSGCPCRNCARTRPSAACEWTSMKPGVTSRPFASMTRAAVTVQLSDRDDGSCPDTYVGGDPRITRAIHDAPVLDQDIERTAGLGGPPRTQKPRKQGESMPIEFATVMAQIVVAVGHEACFQRTERWTCLTDR